MIDVENRIFNIIYQAALACDNTIYCTTETDNAPPSFPAVYVEFIDNYEPDKFIQSDRKEIFNAVAFNVHVYSSKASGKRAECRKIMKCIDEELSLANYKRTAYGYVYLTDGNSTILSSKARYSAVVNVNGNAFTS